jgi:hypothetical protein
MHAPGGGKLCLAPTAIFCRITSDTSPTAATRRHSCLSSRAIVTATLREPMEAYALDSSRESDTLTLDNTGLWQKNEDVIET